MILKRFVRFRPQGTPPHAARGVISVQSAQSFHRNLFIKHTPSPFPHVVQGVLSVPSVQSVPFFIIYHLAPRREAPNCKLEIAK